MAISATESSLDLSIGEPCYGPPQEAKAAAAARLLSGSNGYVNAGGLPELRHALARKLNEKNKILATSDQVVVTTGASLGIFSILVALCEPGDAVAVPDPGFPLYHRMLETLRLRPIAYKLRSEAGGEPNWTELSVIAKKARVMIWNFPSNPLGSVAGVAWFTRLEDLMRANSHLYLISDEVYEDLVFSGKHISPASAVSAGRIFSVFSFSKSYGMTGWRVGYLHAPDDWANQIAKVHWGMTMSTPTISQHAALACLSAAPTYHAEIKQFLSQNRSLALQKLKEWDVACATPDGTFFLWLSLTGTGFDAETFATRSAQECNVLVSPGTHFSEDANDHIRICFAVTTNVLEEGLDRIGQWLKRNKQTNRSQRRSVQISRA
jgi:aspartate/methionine/tyrosine aminotransferase